MATLLGTREARRELHELRVEEWGDLGLAAITIALSLVATQAAPKLALPLFIGGVFAMIIGCRALVRRWDLFDSLLLDSDNYAIPEVRARAEETASPENRARLARSIRALLDAPARYRSARVALVADELDALADELDDAALRLDPLCAVRCRHLVTNAVESPLLSSAVPEDGLRIAITVIRSGFEPN